MKTMPLPSVQEVYRTGSLVLTGAFESIHSGLPHSNRLLAIVKTGRAEEVRDVTERARWTELLAQSRTVGAAFTLELFALDRFPSEEELKLAA